MPSIDTVSDIPRRVQYVASAAQTDFDYPFPIFTDADLTVDVDGVIASLNTDYTVAGEGDDTGGTITWTGTAFTGGEIVTIYSDMVIERLTDIAQNGPWSSSAYNDEQDKTYLILRELKDNIQRCLRIPIAAEVDGDDIELDVATWANTYVTIDANGKPTPAALSATTITQAILGQLQFPRSQDEIDAAITPTNFNFDYGVAPRYGVVGDGVTNDTNALTDMCNAVGTAGKVVVPAGFNCLMGRVQITSKNLHFYADGATFTLSGNASGFLVDGTVTNFRVHGGTVVGDGANRDSNTANAQIAWCFGNSSGAAVSDVKLFGVVARDCNVAFKFADSRSGGGTKTRDCHLFGCLADGMVGQVGGMGYGFQFTQADDSGVTGCIARDCERHGIYFAEGKNYTASDSQVIGGGFGSVRGGIVASRSANVVISNCLVDDRDDTGIVIDTDTQGLAPDNVCNGVVIRGCVINDCTLQDLKIGTDTPDTDGYPTNVLVDGLVIRTKSGKTNNNIVITSGSNIVLKGLNIDASGAGASQRAVSLSAPKGASYYSDITIKVDHIKTTGTGFGISVASALCTSSTQMDLQVAQLSGGGSEYEFAAGEDSVTNTALRYLRSRRKSGRTYTSSGTAITVAAGVDYIVFSASGATTVSTFSGGNEGDVLRLFFTNGNTTIKATNIYLAGAVDFTATADDTLELWYIGGAWREASRSAN